MLFSKKTARIIAALMCLCMMMALCACGAKTAEAEVKTVETQATSQPTEEIAAEVVEEEPTADITTGKPWLASCVQGVLTADTQVNLKDDFYAFVNKEDILNYVIKPGYSSAGLIYQRSQDNEKDILALFTETTEAKSHDAQLALDLYGLFMDWDKRNELGVEPLKSVIEPVESLINIEELSNYYKTYPVEKQASAVFSCSPTADLIDSNTYIMDIASPELLLDDSAEYAEMTELGKLTKEVNDEVALYMLDRLGYSKEDAQKKLDNCYALEYLMAPSIYTSEEMNSPDIYAKINNHPTNEEMEALEGNLPILEKLDLYGFERKETVLLDNPKWLEAMQTIYTDENIDLIKDYMIVHTVLSKITSLDRECFEKYLDAYNKFRGSEGYLSDEEYASKYVKSMLSWPVARLYCEKYVTEEEKEDVKSICESILASYEKIIQKADFISDETKEKAIDKLKSISINSLYPDSWDKYSCEELNFANKEEGGSYFDAQEAIECFAVQDMAKRFSEPVDKERWDGFDPTVVNAFYNPQNNSVNMLAGLCRGDIYNKDMSIEEKYAKIGVVIGHEISHSFDASGSQFDKEGNMTNWWTDEDSANFAEKVQRVADYASSVECWEGTSINGTIITGEAIADMGGISCMLSIAKDIEGFDYDLFFRSYAKLWSEVTKYNTFVSNLKDVHPPEFYRVNATIQQFDEFYETYGIEEGDGMYLAPENRIAVW